MQRLSHILAAVVLVVATPALAANLVTNGSFETGNFTGFTQFGNTGFTGVVGSFGGVSPTDGSYQAAFGPVGSQGGIAQDIATVSGRGYRISFDIANLGSVPNSVSVDFGGFNLLTLHDTLPLGYSSYAFLTDATSASTALSFAFQQDPSYFVLDNISVTAVPEPATWALMIGGFAMTGLGMRRRKIAVTA